MGALGKLLALAVPGLLLASAIPAFAQNWEPTSAPAFSWLSLAGSADATKLFAINGPWGGAVQAIYRSTNSGATWQMAPAPSEPWWSISSSADGAKLVAASSKVYLSRDSGDTWAQTSDTNVWGGHTASSADGSRLLVANGGVFVSTNSGANWNYSSWPSPPWRSAACSADGNTFILAGSFTTYHYVTGQVAISTNWGVTWRPADLPECMGWTSAAVSADGTRLIATAANACALSPWTYVSTNRGITWNLVDLPAGWDSVSSSADGMRLAASGSGWQQPIFVSDDAGASWTSADAPSTNWSSIIFSADGNRVVAAAGAYTAPRGLIYTWQTTPSPKLNITPVASSLRISWIVPSLPFVLQANADLNPANWANVAVQPLLNFTNLHHEVTLPLSSSNRLYRLKSL